MDDIKTLLKVLVIATFYFGMTPLLGSYLKGKDVARRVTLGFLAVWCDHPRTSR